MATTPKMIKSASSTIGDFLNAVGAVKSAESHTEAGSIGGETTHPIKDVDDGTEPAKEGERSAENSKDVKKDNPLSIEHAPEAKAASARKKKAGEAITRPGSAADDVEESVLNVQATGDDPEAETQRVKAKKDDPGSTHPARTDNDELDGHKYAVDRGTPFTKLASMASDLGGDICAHISWMSSNPNTQQKSAAIAGDRAPDQSQKSASADDSELAAQAGWELAGLINGTMDKKAADAMVQNAVAGIIKVANDEADLAAQCYSNYFRAKQAEEEGVDPAAMGGLPPMPPGDPAMGGLPPMPGGPPPGEDEMMGLLGGGADAGGGPPPGPGGEGGMGGEGGGDPEAEAQQLAQALAQLGVSEEELMAAMEGDMGGEGGAPPEAGMGGPPPAGMGGPPPGGPGMEVAASYRPQGGRTQQGRKAPATEKTAAMVKVISEIIDRSRGRR